MSRLNADTTSPASQSASRRPAPLLALEIHHLARALHITERAVRGKRLPPFPELAPHQFDVVFLDPPRYAKSAFGVVDLINDYPALFKPALLCTKPGGTLICCNNVAQVDRDAWAEQLTRSATKAGRPIREMEWITPEEDFPSPDGKPPLKILLMRV
mgnify:CR=1 FL=1